MSSLVGKVISITGAASGMGQAFARLAATHGARLALADVQKEALEELTSELQSVGVDATGTVVDVSSSTQVDNWISGTVKKFGRLDSAANIAGILGKHAKFADTTNEAWNRVFGVNLFGVMNCVRAQVQVMQKGAAIVNMSSVLGTQARADHSIYAISKHGVVGLTKSVAKEIGPLGIRVNAIAPGPIHTPMARNNYSAQALEQISQHIPLQRWGTPEEVANLAAFLLGEESSFMTGHVNYIDGGFSC